jgi:hypothetical protein
MLKKALELIGILKGQAPFINDLLAFGGILWMDVIAAQADHGESSGDPEAQAAKHRQVRDELDKMLDEKGGLEWPSFLQDDTYQDMVLDKLIWLIVKYTKSGK